MLLHIPGYSQEAKSSHTIRLKNETVTAPSNARPWLDSIATLSAGNDPLQVLMHFSTLPTKEQRNTLAQNGITLLDYIPDNTYTAIVQPHLNTARLANIPFYNITVTKPEWKADPYTWQNVNKAQGQVEVLVSFYGTAGDQAIRQFITTIGGRIEASPMEQYGNYKVVIAANKIRTIAQWYGVKYISPSNEMIPLDLQSRPAVKGNIAVIPQSQGGYGLAGDSVTVGVGDNASGIYHVDLKDRITNFNPAPPGNHGAHVNGIVGGAGIADPMAPGMAPHVSLVDYLYDQVLSATGPMYNGYNMTISNNSYTVVESNCGYAGTYDNYAVFADTLHLQNPNVLHVFASGNDGGMDCSPYPKGFATVCGGYQPSKNSVIVGSMTDFLIDAHDESRGPTKDGRMKPEIVAVGLGAYSTVTDDSYVWAAGTSMASPQVAGGLAILTQHYKHLNGGVQPPADVLKTILLNGCMDLGNPGPDYTYGFGSMDVSRSLKIIDNNNIRVDSVSNGDNRSFTINVPPNTAQLKVMLYWHDAPANPSSAKQLVNDVDLVVSDPSAGNHLPLGLDPTPTNVNNIATEKPDHLNNAEQVTINNPAAGTYTINTNGFSIPFGPQKYVITYDMLPQGLHLTYPLGGEQLSNVNAPTDSLRVFWNALSDGNTFTVQFSSDDGNNWTTISNNIPANIRNCDFVPEFVNSGNCRVRLIRNNTSEVVTSGRFAVNDQTVVELDDSQCPGYINIHWAPVPNATGYYLHRKIGKYLQLVDSTSGTNYTFKGMPINERSYVAVQPIMNGIPGYRSKTLRTVANTGDCADAVSNGDLLAETIIAPTNGRVYTSTDISGVTAITVKLKNLYSADCNSYNLSYKINAGPWQTVVNPGTIPANSTAAINIPGVSFAATGSYNVTVAVTNTGIADPQQVNDTFSTTILNIPNDTISLASPFTDDFETMGKVSITHDSVGVAPNGHWDYFNINDSGRMRSFVNESITISGDRSISLDEDRNVKNGSKNTFNGTFNLSNYDTGTTEVRVDFDYIIHGNPKTAEGNIVAARGNDTLPWAPFFTYDLSAYPGFRTKALSLSLTDVVRLTGHNFTTSTQVSFGQNDTSLIAAKNFGNGITIDNFKIYTVTNDASIKGIVSPQTSNCGLSANEPLTVRVHNGVNYTLYNMQLFYSMDGGTVYSGTIDSIKAKSDIDFTFAQNITMGAGTTHTLSTWLQQPGDTYTANDSILNYPIRNSRVITSYPYLENFESGDGGFFSDGINNTWQYGTPASPKINKAASGTKAWKTNLTGSYKNLEKSYLYSPCFDISQLAKPMLSFSTALDIENCGNILCDAAYAEYSLNGITWYRLGAAGQGTNWYDTTFGLWNTTERNHWHVATIPIPQLGAIETMHFRFVLSSDPGVTNEGMAIDDIHVYDLANPIFEPAATTTVTQEPANGQWTNYLLDNKLLASIQPEQSMSKTSITLYRQDTVSNPSATQYTFPRSYAIKAEQEYSGKANIRLLLSENEVVRVMNDTTCPSCTPVKDAYSLGITQYTNKDHRETENGSLKDDTGGVYTYHPAASIQWVPYDNGYYAQLNANPLSEYWFNNGGPTGNFHANANYLNFIAFKSGQDVTAYWHSPIDTAVTAYRLMRSDDSINFTTILDTASLHAVPGQYSYTDPVNFSSTTVKYYRLQWIMAGQSGAFYSPVRRVDYADSAAGLVTLDAHTIGNNSALVHWQSYIDGIVSNYSLERAIGDNSFTTIANETSLHNYGQQYGFVDVMAEPLATGRQVHYRLTAVLNNGSKVGLPIKTLEWINDNTLAEVYPNPTHDGIFSINWYAAAGTNLRMTITDAAGRNMYEANTTATQWKNTTTFQTYNYPRGMYFIRMEIGGKKYTAKLVYQ